MPLDTDDLAIFSGEADNIFLCVSPLGVLTIDLGGLPFKVRSISTIATATGLYLAISSFPDVSNARSIA